MRAPTRKPNNDNLGMFNVWVTEGKDKNERKARLLESSSHLQDDIRKHVISVFKMRVN